MRANLLLAVFLSAVQCCACAPKPKPVTPPVLIPLPPIVIPDPSECLDGGVQTRRRCAELYQTKRVSL